MAPPRFTDVTTDLVEMSLVLVVATGVLVAGSMFIYAGAAKLRDISGATQGVRDYRLIPAGLARPAAALLGVVELIVGVGVVLSVRLVLVAAICLLTALSVAAMSALARGLNIDCHCSGRGEPLSRRTVLRNALFALALVFGLVSGSTWTLEASVFALPLGNAVVIAALTAMFAAFATAISQIPQVSRWRL